ncbi:MAG: glycosyltransferase [Gemmatimonadales bacterium]|jgi:UDP:flavonoid glycosyltransferase YjiC (YdhE family)
MHITLATVGSRGDVHPYVALGIGLQRAGHHVRVATHPYFEALVRRRGLDFAPIAGNPRDAVESDLGQAWLATGSNGLAFVRRMFAIMRPSMATAVRDAEIACRDSDVVLFSLLGWLGVHHVLEKHDLMGYPTYLQPATPTRAVPPVVAPAGCSFGGAHNRLLYAVGEQVFWVLMRRELDTIRRDVLGLPPMTPRAPFAEMRRRNTPTLYGYSPTLLPEPSDWPTATHVTGYWSLEMDADWEPSTELLAFLDAGSPPVYVGFGSMHARDVERQTRLVVEALARAGQRGIVLTGWGALSAADLPRHVFAVDAIPHDWLFPRTSAVVHHCGAGTTGAGLRAGVPTVPIPFFADQPFWGRCLHGLGVASKPIPFRRLSVERLTGAIRHAVANPAVRDRAAEVGERVRSENGVARAVELVERYAKSR